MIYIIVQPVFLFLGFFTIVAYNATLKDSILYMLQYTRKGMMSPGMLF